MRKKQVLCLLCAVTVMAASIPYAPQRAYASEIIQEETEADSRQETEDGKTENIWEDETGIYEIIEQDSQGRELLARSGNIYITTEYDDFLHKTVQYCSEGPLQGNNYDWKTTTREIEENEFHSVCIVTTETESGTTVEEYDEDGNTTRSVSETGEVAVNYYQDGNLVKTIQPYTGTPQDALYTHTYEYDAQGRLTAEYSPAAQNEDGSISYFIQKYTYDGEGNMTSYQKTVNEPGEPEA